jgi:hypothetical protein
MAHAACGDSPARLLSMRRIASLMAGGGAQAL